MKIARIMVMFAICCVFAGCGETYRLTKSHTRDWSGRRLIYNLSIQTEPSEAKIYINQKYIGVSTIGYTVEIPNVIVQEYGQQPYDHYDDGWGTIYDSNFGSIMWGGDLYPSFGTTVVEVEAFKEGYNDASRKIEIDASNGNIREAFKGIHPDSERQIPASFTVTEDVLIKLYPKPESSTPKRQGEQQQQQTVVIGAGNNSSSSKGTGTVVVKSNIDAADIFVDGLFVGNTPAALKLVDGIHIIEVRAGGRETYKREIRVFAEAELTLKADFK